jgi:hypothetical protein
MSIQFTTTPTPVMPPLCEPFDFSRQEQLPVATDPETCTAAGQVEFGKFRTTFEPFQCSRGNDTAQSADEADDRKHCVIAGKPLLRHEFNDMANRFEAVTVLSPATRRNSPVIWIQMHHMMLASG